MGNDSRDGWDPKDVSGGGSILKTGLARRYKGTPSLLVPLGNVLAQATGGWHSVFLVAAAMNLLAGARRPLLCFGHCGSGMPSNSPRLADPRWPDIPRL
jgi:hypothetical protein